MKALRALFDWTVYLLSFASPRRDDIWIFIGWRRSAEREIFAENPKYVFLEASKRKGLRAVWIGNDEEICALLRSHGFEAYSRRSLRGIYLSLRAGYSFIGGLLQPANWRYSGGTKLIQLWHGKSLKKTGYASPYSLSRFNRFLSASIFKEPYRFIAMSQYFARYVQSDFHVPTEHILVSGLPKHDALFRDVEGSEIDAASGLQEKISAARALSPRRLIFFAPTFRPDGANPLELIDLAALDKVLAERNDRVIIGLHPKFSAREWVPQDEFTHITFDQNDRDSYPQLSRFDVLISDYSSLCLEFLMIKKPVIQFTPDLESFKQGMGIYEELWDAMPGPKTRTFEELVHALSEDLTTYEAKAERSRETLFKFFDGRSSERVVNELHPLA